MAKAKGFKAKRFLVPVALFLALLCASLLQDVVLFLLRRPWKLQPASRMVEKGGNLEFLLRRLVRGEARKQLEKNGISCVSDAASDFCITSAAVRIAAATTAASPTTTVYLAAGQRLPHSVPRLILHPYPRKYDPVAMQRTSPVHLIPGLPDHPLPCDFSHPAPAVVFSTGGFAGNFFHDVSDVLLPLFLTASHLRLNVVLVVADLQPWWAIKFRRVLSKLSSFELIVAGPADRVKVHCFPAAVVGLRFHGDMACNATEAPTGVSILDFCGFLRRALSLRSERAATGTGGAPLLVLLSRRGSRAILNEEEVAGAAREAGFQVVVADRRRTLGLRKFAALVNGCSVLMGVHGAGLANMVFLPPGAVVIQVVPWGLDWAAATYFGRPAVEMGLRYLEYRVSVEESTLGEQYPRDHPVLADPWAVHRRGYNVSRPIYTEGQDVRLDVTKLRETLSEALRLLPRSHGGRRY